jgi:hypothetical protein
MPKTERGRALSQRARETPLDRKIVRLVCRSHAKTKWGIHGRAWKIGFRRHGSGDRWLHDPINRPNDAFAASTEDNSHLCPADRQGHERADARHCAREVIACPTIPRHGVTCGQRSDKPAGMKRLIPLVLGMSMAAMVGCTTTTPSTTTTTTTTKQTSNARLDPTIDANRTERMPNVGPR